MKRFESPMLVTLLCGLCFLSGLDAPAAYADFTFGEPVNLGPVVNSPYAEAAALLSPDGLELYFQSDRPDGYEGADIWVVKRKNAEEDWGAPANLGPEINLGTWAQAGTISTDGLTLYFASDRLGGDVDLYRAARTTKDDPWGTPISLGPVVNSLAYDDLPVVSADGLELFFMSDRAGGSGDVDIWVATRATEGEAWGKPENLGPTVNTAAADIVTHISPDGLRLLVLSGRPGGFGHWDTYMATRSSKGAAWALPVNLGPSFNTAYSDEGTSMSCDGLFLYFDDYGYQRPGGCGGSDLWRVPILPIVDFNGDEIVDTDDLVTLIEHWGQYDPLCDMGPMPWGDGKVDEKDLKVLMSYWGQEVHDSTLIAHWKLDEASGMIAADSAGTNNGTLVGNPTWQPTGGKVGGALTFDGTNDFGLVNLALNPPGKPFSVLAWVKGGAPGEVVIAEQNGRNWLFANSADGCLSTALNSPGQPATALGSQAAITDGQWHRIGVVWDGTNRILCVDDEEVARDALSTLDIPSAKLVIGCGATFAPATFWSSLIDDIRIYNREVKP